MSLSSGKTTTEFIREMGEQLESGIIDMRRDFHRRPEVGGNEHETSVYLGAVLETLGIEYRLVEGKRPAGFTDEREEFIGTGIIATIRGEAAGAYNADGIPAKRVALRADMDALPVAERTGAPYASLYEGVMHACGHDCHMAMMVGAATMINELRDRLRGEVRIIFQPAEEISIGARDMIAAGAVDGVDALYGAHIWSEIDAGMFSCEAGPRMANTDWFRIDIEGVSAHGSMPHKGVDAIVVAAEIVNSIQVLVSRDTSPFDPVVVTVGEIHGGTARNVMAGSAYLTGTVRTWKASTREEVFKRLEHIAGEVTEAFGAKFSFEYEAGNPAVVNDPALAQSAREAVVEVLGEQAVAQYEGTLAGEDFAEYRSRVPSVFVFIGGRNPEIGADHPQHSCYYAVDESVLVKGAMVAAQWAADMLA